MGLNVPPDRLLELQPSSHKQKEPRTAQRRWLAPFSTILCVAQVKVFAAGVQPIPLQRVGKPGAVSVQVQPEAVGIDPKNRRTENKKA